MDDLISRRDAINVVSEITTTMSVCTNKDECYGMKRMQKQAITELENMPSAEPETAKRIVGKSRDGMTLWYQCDRCNEPVDARDNYCRGCGRRLIDETD